MYETTPLKKMREKGTNLSNSGSKRILYILKTKETVVDKVRYGLTSLKPLYMHTRLELLSK